MRLLLSLCLIIAVRVFVPSPTSDISEELYGVIVHPVHQIEEENIILGIELKENQGLHIRFPFL